MGLLNNEAVQAVLKNRKHLFEQKGYNPRDSFRQQPKQLWREQRKAGFTKAKMTKCNYFMQMKDLAGLTGIGKFWYANEEGKCWKK